MGWRYIALLGFLKARELLKPEANGYQTALIICILFSCISIPKERNIPEKILLNAYRAVLEAVATRAARFIGDRAGLAATTAVRNRHCHPCPSPSALSTHGITEVQKELEGTHQDPWVHPALHSPQQSPCASEPCPNTSGTRAGVMLGSPSREACPRAHFPDFQPKCPASTSALCLCPRSQKQKLALPLSSQLRPQGPLLQTKSVHLLFRSPPRPFPTLVVSSGCSLMVSCHFSIVVPKSALCAQGEATPVQRTRRILLAAAQEQSTAEQTSQAALYTQVCRALKTKMCLQKQRCVFSHELQGEAHETSTKGSNIGKKSI